MRILGFKFRPYLYLFTSVALSLSCAEAFAIPDPSGGYTPQKTMDAWGENASPQGKAAYDKNKWEKANPPQNGTIANGAKVPGAKSAPKSNAGTNAVGEQIQEKNKPDPKEQENAVDVKGGTTKCMFTGSQVEPNTMVDEKPYVQQGQVTAKNPGSGEQVSSDDNIQKSIGNTYGNDNTGVDGKQKKAQTALTPTGSVMAHAVAAAAAGFVQKVSNPSGMAAAAKGAQQAQNSQNSDNQGNSAQQNCDNAFTCMKLPLINVANENAASPCSSSAPFKDESNVIWMVQQMYHKCYVPMAILFLLPGAVITQVKSLVSFGILNNQDEDTKSPFMGIFRAIMAIFLIPATQLVMSYCIDIGNALTDPIAKQVQVETIMNWVQEQAYATDPKNNDNTIKKITGKQTMGKLAGTSAKKAVQERQSDLSVSVQNMFNTINNMMSQGLEVLNGFQIVMMCYLFLLGPIAAALYAWPAAVGRDLFKKAFSSWLDGVIVLSLWKVWWCIVLLCMAVRLQQGVDPNSQFEMYYYTAFMGILVMVPFQPFEFRPGEIVSQVLEKAQQGSGGGGGGGGGGSGKGGGGGGGSGGGGTPQNANTGGSDSSTQTTKAEGQGQTDQGSKMAGQGGDKTAGGKSSGESGGTVMAGDFETTSPEHTEPPKSGPTAIG